MNERTDWLARASRLAWLTVGWNFIEGGVAILAAALAGSVALLGFGISSVVECASGLVVLWRVRAERHLVDHEEIERLDGRARKLIALSLFALATYVAFDAVTTLWVRREPAPSLLGLAVTAISPGVMWWLARRKRRVASALSSRAIEADAAQTSACWWLALAALVGVGLNRLFGWWWADPIAALVMTLLILREGREAWRGEACCN